MFQYPAWFGWLVIFLTGWLLTSGIGVASKSGPIPTAAHNLMPSPTRVEGL